VEKKGLGEKKGGSASLKKRQGVVKRVQDNGRVSSPEERKQKRGGRDRNIMCRQGGKVPSNAESREQGYFEQRESSGKSKNLRDRGQQGTLSNCWESPLKRRLVLGEEGSVTSKRLSRWLRGSVGLRALGRWSEGEKKGYLFSTTLKEIINMLGGLDHH